MYPSLQGPTLEVRGILLEDRLDRLFRLVELAFRQCDLRQQAPGGKVVRRFLGDLSQQLLGLLLAPGQEVEVGQPDPGTRAGRCVLGRRLELLLGLRPVTLGDVEAGQCAVSLDGLGFPRDGQLLRRQG